MLIIIIRTHGASESPKYVEKTQSRQIIHLLIQQKDMKEKLLIT